MTHGNLADDLMEQASHKLDDTKRKLREAQEYIVELQSQKDHERNKLTSRIESLQSTIRTAAAHLARYRYDDNHEALQHEVGMVIDDLRREA
jgi:peptidoglycan hydrolase CwlO-like protein